MGGILGQPKTGGRKKGTPNKITLDLVALLEEQGFSPAAKLVENHALAMKEYERAAEIFDAIQDKRADYKLVPLHNDNACNYLKLAQGAASDLMSYVYPKRKAIEHTGAGGANLFDTLAELYKAGANHEHTAKDGK